MQPDLYGNRNTHHDQGTHTQDQEPPDHQHNRLGYQMMVSLRKGLRCMSGSTASIGLTWLLARLFFAASSRHAWPKVAGGLVHTWFAWPPLPDYGKLVGLQASLAIPSRSIHQQWRDKSAGVDCAYDRRRRRSRAERASLCGGRAQSEERLTVARR